MNADNFLKFSEPFVKAARNVFETMVFSKIETQKPFIKDNHTSQGDISAVLGLTGETKDKRNYSAQLVLSWPEDTYLKIAGAMLSSEYTEVTEDIEDVGAEIVNMIMGNAKSELVASGLSTNMAIPSTIRGNGHMITYPKNSQIFVIPIKTAHGAMFMEICYDD